MATAITVRVNVLGVSEALAAGYDRVKVYRAATAGGAYAEVTTAGTRLTLLSGQLLYTFVDAAGELSAYYRWALLDSVTLAEGEPSEPVRGDAMSRYASVDDVRAEGVPSSASDARINALIDAMQAFVEARTRQWFLPREMTWELDGSGSWLLQLPVPIIYLTELRIDSVAVSSDLFTAYTGRGGAEADHRRNPRIKFISTSPNIFSGTGPLDGPPRFTAGERNVAIDGVFGFQESGVFGGVPPLIRRAVVRLVCRSVRPMVSGGGATGPVIEEETDRHRRKYADPTAGGRVLTATGDVEVDQILAMYKAPLIVRAPRSLLRQ